jgi:uncharacterized membrane protein YuzA (DUF378 family)
MKRFLKDNWLFIVAILIYCLNVFPGALRGFTAFTYDNGRDMLAAFGILYEHKFTLIGPTTGIGGVFHGAWAYYWFALLSLIFGGQPTGVAIAFGIVGLLGMFVLYLMLKSMFNERIAGYGTVIYAISPHVIDHFTQIGQNNMVPFFVLLSLFCFWQFLSRKKDYWLFLFGIFSAFIFEFEVALGIFTLPATIIFLTALFVVRKTKFLQLVKKMSIFAIGMLIPMSLRLIFELRHNFFMTKTLIASFLHPDVKVSLFRNMSLGERMLNRLQIFYDFWLKLLPQQLQVVTITLLIFLIIFLPFVYKTTKKLPRVFLIYCLFIVFFLLVAFSYYKDVVWGNYLSGFSLYYLLILCYFLKYVHQKAATLLLIFFSGLIIFSFPSLTANRITDQSAIVNQLAAINYIYADAGKNADFSVGVFSPSWFSYPYDYWFKWREKFKGVPPPKSLWKTKINYLIVEPPDNPTTAKQWFDKFMDKNANLESTKYFGRLKVEKWRL